jgi:hypothetical protein
MLAGWSFAFTANAQNNAKPIISAHDFRKATDLWESVGLGVINYQADVMYIYGQLYVTDAMPDSANHHLPTLTEAYLYPLYNQFKKNNGEFLPGYQGDIYLILNFSCQPLRIYKQLAAEMRPFAEMLTYHLEGQQHQGKLTVLITDSKALAEISSIKQSFLGLVGTTADLYLHIDSEKMPLISIKLNELTDWKGFGNIPFDDFAKLRQLVEKVHAQNKKIVLTDCPASKNIADLVKSAKIDFVSTPDDQRMARYFLESN